MIKYATTQFHRDKMIATTSADNIPAQRVLENSGFLRYGTTEDILADGKVEKQITFERLLKESIKIN